MWRPNWCQSRSGDSCRVTTSRVGQGQRVGRANRFYVRGRCYPQKSRPSPSGRSGSSSRVRLVPRSSSHKRTRFLSRWGRPASTVIARPYALCRSISTRARTSSRYIRGTCVVGCSPTENSYGDVRLHGLTVDITLRWVQSSYLFCTIPSKPNHLSLVRAPFRPRRSAGRN